MNFWKGTKVRLRGIEPSDAETLFKWNLDSERARYIDFLWPPISEAAVRAWAEEQSKHKLENDTFHWLIENHGGEPVGTISTHRCNPHHGTFTYGLDVAREHRRNGYAGEAILLVLKYYFEELRYQKVTVAVYSDNTASIQLHEKLGFQHEGTHRRTIFTRGEYLDTVWYGMTVEEFRAIVSLSN